MNDIFTQRGLHSASSYSISVGKKVSANLFKELFAMFGYSLFFIMNFCYEKKMFSF